ncbi:MAG TPA: hypothetical protein VG900_08445 [Hyphomicrobiaceae bacterium]|nr:hypothetical protein [Hyphomicrobiaceae bacterium]
MPRKLERELDEALAQTFPASDPFSITQDTSTEPPGRPVDRQAPALDEAELAASRRRTSKSKRH